MLSVSHLCAAASDLSPNQWPVSIIEPYSLLTHSIFGHQQVAMERNRGVSLIDALVRTGLSESNGQARQAIKGNAVMVNRVKVTDPARILTKEDALPNLDAIVIENGRFNFGIVELCD